MGTVSLYSEECGGLGARGGEQRRRRVLVYITMTQLEPQAPTYLNEEAALAVRVEDAQEEALPTAYRPGAAVQQASHVLGGC